MYGAAHQRAGVAFALHGGVGCNPGDGRTRKLGVAPPHRLLYDFERRAHAAILPHGNQCAAGAVDVLRVLVEGPGANEGRAECWVFKIAYSLQEAITRDGDSIKIDGAEVAKRLSKFGDDFRRRNKGRWYFHLTVGVGSLFSPPPPDPAGGASEDLRFTPLIAEQVGFGYASPAVWKDRLTFKFGLAASGILYRMLLDNEESNAVMGMGFVAMDIYDLVEIYAAGTVLAYPPDDMSDARVEPGFAVGLSVPLSAYLEKL